jgi:hypothetical protein
MEPVYRVSFFKRLTDSTGHQFETCQSAVEVHACSGETRRGPGQNPFRPAKASKLVDAAADYHKPELLPKRKRVSAAIWNKTAHTN